MIVLREWRRSMLCSLLRTSVVVVAAFVMGCAQDEADVVGHAAPPSAAEANVPVGQTEVRTVEAPPLADYRVLSAASFEMRPGSSWTREERGGFEVFAAPGGQVKVLVSVFGDKDDMAARRDAALALVEGSEVRPSEQRSLRVGDAQLEAVAQDGALRLPSGDAGFQCAVVTGAARKLFVAYVFGKDAPESTRADGMRMIATLRDKQ
jgi:hypothetical protein